MSTYDNKQESKSGSYTWEAAVAADQKELSGTKNLLDILNQLPNLQDMQPKDQPFLKGAIWLAHMHQLFSRLLFEAGKSTPEHKVNHAHFLNLKKALGDSEFQKVVDIGNKYLKSIKDIANFMHNADVAFQKSSAESRPKDFLSGDDLFSILFSVLIDLNVDTTQLSDFLSKIKHLQECWFDSNDQNAHGMRTLEATLWGISNANNSNDPQQSLAALTCQGAIAALEANIATLNAQVPNPTVQTEIDQLNKKIATFERCQRAANILSQLSSNPSSQADQAEPSITQADIQTIKDQFSFSSWTQKIGQIHTNKSFSTIVSSNKKEVGVTVFLMAILLGGLTAIAVLHLLPLLALELGIVLPLVSALLVFGATYWIVRNKPASLQIGKPILIALIALASTGAILVEAGLLPLSITKPLLAAYLPIAGFPVLSGAQILLIVAIAVLASVIAVQIYRGAERLYGAHQERTTQAAGLDQTYQFLNTLMPPNNRAQEIQLGVPADKVQADEKSISVLPSAPPPPLYTLAWCEQQLEVIKMNAIAGTEVSTTVQGRANVKDYGKACQARAARFDNAPDKNDRIQQLRRSLFNGQTPDSLKAILYAFIHSAQTNSAREIIDHMIQEKSFLKCIRWNKREEKEDPLRPPHLMHLTQDQAAAAIHDQQQRLQLGR